jgi:penicillin-binding protein 1A
VVQFLVVLLGGVATGVGVAAVIRIPSVDDLDSFAPSLITEVRAADNSVFRSYANERREMLEEGEVPEVFRRALLAAEDKNFYEHSGLDLVAALRSAIIDIRTGELETGASTLTMQLARTYFELGYEKRWRRKIQETLIAVELEKRLSKEQILTLYCNVHNFGEGRYGLKAATRYYFDKDVSNLTLSEAAMLTGVLPAPSRLSPYRRPEQVLRLRNRTLDRMRRENMISAEEHALAVASPLGLTKRTRRPEPGRYFAEEIRRYLEDSYGAEAIYDRGLQVHTTLHPAMQRAAERAVRDRLGELDRRRGWRDATYRLEEDDDPATAELPSWPEEAPQLGEWYEAITLEASGDSATLRIGDLEYLLDAEGVEWTGTSRIDRLLDAGEVAWVEVVGAAAPAAEDENAPAVAGRVALRQAPEMEVAAVLVESATGAVRAMVGGWDYSRSQFNRVTQARRQVGSAFKPFVYGAALEAGYTPADTLFDAPVVFPGADQVLDYSPRNYKRKYLGVLTLRRALEGSVNVTATKLLDMVGPERAIDFARRSGIESDLQPYPSLALGAADLTPMEIAAGYATIANQGVRVEPYLLERITTREGRVLEEHIPRAVEVISPQVAYVLTDMLRGVFRRGTAASAANIGVPTAGKTGTTDSYTDAWFAGFTPRYTLLVWVGYDQVRYLGRGMTGAAAALPIWRGIIEDGVAEGWIDPAEDFVRPPGISTRRIEYYTGLLANDQATRTIREVFLEGTEPVQQYEGSWARVIDLPWYQQRPFYGLPKEGERMPEQVTDWTLVQERWKGKDEGEEGDEEAEVEPAG